MSETHPNKQKLARGRGRYRLRRILESWPFLIWFGMAFMTLWLYGKGIVFKRMSGAVDVYQESIAPLEPGKVHEILFKTGDVVERGATVAVMDVGNLNEKIRRLETTIQRRNLEAQVDLSTIERHIHNLFERQQEHRSKIGEIRADIAKVTGELAAAAGVKKTPALQGHTTGSEDRADDKARLTSELAGLNVQLEGEQQILADVTAERAATVAERNRLTGTGEASMPGETKTKAQLEEKLRELASIPKLDLRDLADIEDYQARLARLELTTVRGGRIDRIGKEEGEVVARGEYVVKVVAAPENVIGFLPQDQLEQVQRGDKVWISPSHDRHTHYETTISSVSPRINNVPDRASPLPNRTLRGRDVILEYPADLKKIGKETGVYPLLPGQAVIIHLEKPGEISFVRSLFGSD